MPDTRRWVQQCMRWYLFRPMIGKCVHGCQESSARSTGAWRTTVTRNSGRTSVQVTRLILRFLQYYTSVQYRVMIISPAVHTQYCPPYRRTIRTGTLCFQRYCLNFIGCDGLMPIDITDTGISNTSGTTPVPVLSPARYVLPQDDFTSKDDSLIYFTSGSVVIGNDLYVIDWNHYRILKFEQPGEYFDDTTAGRNLHAVVERPVSSASDRMMWSHSAHPIPGGVCLSTGPSSSPKR